MYELILGFSYVSSFFIQIRPIYTFFASVLIINLVKYNEEINMTVKFLMNMFKQSCMIMFLIFFLNFEFFEKISISTISGWVGCWRKIFFCHALFHASDEASLTEASCKISTRSDNYFKSYAVFSIFFLVGWLVCLDSSAFFKTHQNIGEEPS